MTPAQKLGYAVGDWFIVNNVIGNPPVYKHGDKVRLIRDDNTDMPEFFVERTARKLYITLYKLDRYFSDAELLDRI